MDFSTFGVSIAAVIIFLYFFYHKKFNYWKSRNIPYLKPTPIFGNVLPYTLGHVNYHQYMKGIYDSVSNQPFIGIYQIFNPVLIICDPKLSNNILVKNFQCFSDRDMLWFIRKNKSLHPLSENVATQNGFRWKYMRQKLNPLFTSTKGRKIVFKYAHKATKKITKFLDNSDEDIDLANICTKYMIAIICPWLLAVEPNSFKEENCEILAACEQIFNVNFTLRHILYGIHPKLLDLLRIPDFNTKSSQMFVSLIKEVIQFREKNNVKQEDLLDLLVDIINSPTPHEMDKFDEYDIYGNIFGSFLASFESTMTTVMYALFELALNTDIQEEVRKEVAGIWKQNTENLDFTVLNEMKYFDMVMSETLRKYPVDAVIFRKCTEKFHLPETNSWIDPGTTVLIPIYGFHHDPRYYPNPDTFIPERFSSENKSSIPSGAYIPFGEGPRMCTGTRVTPIMFKMVLFEVLHKYRLSVSEKTQLPLKFKPGIFTLTPENGIWLKFDKLVI